MSGRRARRERHQQERRLRKIACRAGKAAWYATLPDATATPPDSTTTPPLGRTGPPPPPGRGACMRVGAGIATEIERRRWWWRPSRLRTERRVNGADFAALLPDVARRLLGDPPRIGADEWRYGSRGSLAVHPARGTWYDFEADAGGGVLDLIEHLQQTDKAGALRYLVDARLIDPPAGADARPAALGRPAAARVSAPIRSVSAESAPAPGSPPKSSVRRPGGDPRRLAGVQVPPESARRADGAGAAPTAAVAAAILAAAGPADDTPARRYLDRRDTWPADGPPLPAAVRWFPPSAWEHLPTWPDRRGRPLRLTPPADGVRSGRPDAPPVPRCGALVYELARPGCAPDAVQVEPVTADGRRLPWTERPRDTKRTPGNNGAARVFEIAPPPGDGWPDAGAAPLVVALVESPGNALALARLHLPGVLIRAAAGAGGLRAGGAALVADLPATVAAALVSDGDPPGRGAVAELHAALQNADRTCYAALLRGGADLDDVLRAADDADLLDRHAERAAILEFDGGLDRPAATALALAGCSKP